MRMSLKSLIPIFLLIAVAPLVAEETLPRFVSADPTNGKAGTVVTITGENIGKAIVAEVYFTDGKNDIKVAVSEQSDTSMKVSIPAAAKPGVRYRLMILTKGKEPKLIEQPVRVEIDE